MASTYFPRAFHIDIHKHCYDMQRFSQKLSQNGKGLLYAKGWFHHSDYPQHKNYAYGNVREVFKPRTPQKQRVRIEKHEKNAEEHNRKQQVNTSPGLLLSKFCRHFIAGSWRYNIYQCLYRLCQRSLKVGIGAEKSLHSVVLHSSNRTHCLKYWYQWDLRTSKIVLKIIWGKLFPVERKFFGAGVLCSGTFHYAYRNLLCWDCYQGRSSLFSKASVYGCNVMPDGLLIKKHRIVPSVWTIFWLRQRSLLVFLVGTSLKIWFPLAEKGRRWLTPLAWSVSIFSKLWHLYLTTSILVWSRIPVKHS